MNKFLVKKAFDSFLVANRCKDKFYKNMAEFNRRFKRRYEKNEYFLSRPCIYYLSDAFEWKSAPEGYNFWYGLALKWRDFCFQFCGENSEV